MEAETQEQKLLQRLKQMDELFNSLPEHIQVVAFSNMLKKVANNDAEHTKVLLELWHKYNQDALKHKCVSKRV